MESNRITISCFGEVLWDLFPDYQRIGGAPLNVALRLHHLGARVHMISQVGKDQYGEGILEFLNEQGLSSEMISRHSDLPTGLVHVQLDEEGTASYTIEKPAAWDAITVDKTSIDSVSSSHALLFGSLSCRSATSRNSLLNLIENSRFSIFDLNLRPPDYDLELINQLINKADLVKMNEEELDEICDHLNIEEGPVDHRIHALKHALKNVKSICVTKGGEGAVWLHRGKLYTNKGFKVKVKDTVGAGDSFLASLIYSMFKGLKPQLALDRACAIGSLVASKEGATPEVSEIEIIELLKA